MNAPYLSVSLELCHVRPDFAYLFTSAQPYAADLRQIQLLQSEWKYEERGKYGYADVVILAPARFIEFWTKEAADRISLEEMAASWIMARAIHELCHTDKLIPF